MVSVTRYYSGDQYNENEMRHVTFIWRKHKYTQVLVGKLKRPFGKPRRRGEDTLKWILKREIVQRGLDLSR